MNKFPHVLGILLLLLCGNLLILFSFIPLLDSTQRYPDFLAFRVTDSLNPPVASTPTYRKLSPFGRACNRIITLATGLERARLENFVLQLYAYEWQPIFEKMDMELFNRTFFGRFEFIPGQAQRAQGDSSWLVSAPEYWCGLKVNLDSIRTGFRPKLNFQKLAQEKIAEMKRTSEFVLSLHLRHYDGLCERLLPHACEAHSSYEFLPRPFGCNQTLTPEYWEWIHQEWSSTTRKSMAVYLSTDRQVKSIDDSYLEVSPAVLKSLYNIDRVFAPEAEELRKGKVRNEYAHTSEMFVDMWISVLSDRHVGMPLSSCDKIVAEWRGAMVATTAEAIGQIKEDAVHPRQCYSKYFAPSQSSLPFCHHTRALGLDTEQMFKAKNVCALCNTLLAYFVTRSKAEKHRMDLHIYGPFAHFIREYFDNDNSTVFTVFLPHSKEEMLFKRRQVYDSGKFRVSGLSGANQAECVRGRAIRLNTVFPRAEIRHQAQTASPILFPSCGGNSLSYCFSSRSNELDKASSLSSSSHQEMDPQAVVTELWRRVMLPDTSEDEFSPCSQIIALWRRDMGVNTGMSPSQCFQQYFSVHDDDDDEILGFKPDQLYWQCP